MVRSALIVVTAASLLLAGFTFAGGLIGLWDPLEPGDSGVRSIRVVDRPDIDAASRAIAPVVAHSEPRPPVSLRITLLIALASLALSVLPILSRLPRWLEDCAWSLRGRIPHTSTGRANVLVASELAGNLGPSREPPPQPALKESRSWALSSRLSALARLKNLRSPPAADRTRQRGVHRIFARLPPGLPVSVARPGRPRSRWALATPVRARAVRSFVYEVRGDAVGLALAVGLGVAIVILSALYANG
jgi:hypothetical protein